MIVARISLWLLVALPFAAFSQRLTLTIRNGSLDTVLLDIQRRTGYLCFFDESCVKEAGPVSFSVRNATVRETLDSCLGDRPIYYELSGRSLNVFPGSLVYGEVVDERGQAVVGATVMLEDQDEGTGTMTDEAGRFRLRLLGADRQVVISYVGYGKQRYRVTGVLRLHVQLVQLAGELSGVVVANGFEDIPAERATGAFTRVGREVIGRRPSSSLIDRLDGVTSGLLVNTNIQAGTNQSTFMIRGRSTIFSNPMPLVVIDNFPYSGDLNNINPEDIESVTVLKDAAAASVWGTRAANGVLVIRMRQGSYRHPARLSVTSSVTVGQRPDVDYQPILASADYIAVEQYLFGKGWYDNTILNPGHPALSPVVEILLRQRQGELSSADTAAMLGQLRSQDIRQDLSRYWYRPAVNQQYWLGLNGGTTGHRYALSAGVDQDAAPLVRNNYRRITVLGNQTNVVIPHKLDLNTSVAFSSSATATNNTVGIQGYYPYLRLVGPTGQALPVANGLRLGYVDTVGDGRLLDWHYRPLDELNNADDVTRLLDWRLNIGAQYTVGAGWLIRLLYQYGQGTSDQQNLQSLQTYYTRNLINSFTQVGLAGELSYPVPVGGILDETVNSYQSHNGRVQLEYHPTLGGEHELHVLAGSEVQDVESRTTVTRTYGYNSASQSGVPVGSYTTQYPQYGSPGAFALIPDPDNNALSWDHYWSYYGNAGYQYRQRYTLTASARLDQSNLFGVDINHKSVPLWSAGLAWEVSREAFYGINSWLPLLRLRLTDGYNGNVYKNVSGYTTANNGIASSIAGITGGFTNSYGAPFASITNPPNPGLRWEQVQVTNAGLDVGGRDSSVQGSIDLYMKQGKYLIGPTSLDPTSGNTSYTANVANMSTHGIDATLRTQVRIGAVRWTSIALFNYVRDRVTRYLVQPPTILSFLTTQTLNPLAGHPLYSLYALRWAGLDPQTGDPRGWLNGHPSSDYASLLNSADFSTLQYKGPLTPPYFGSWRNEVNWRQWGLSINIVYKLGDYFMRPSIQYFSLFSHTSLGHPDYERRWQYRGDEAHTNVPSLIYPASSNRDNFYANSDVLVEKGDLIRLQDLQLYYDLSRKALGKGPVRGLRCYGYVNNIGLLWRANHAGLDPDALTGLPNPHTVTIGVKMEL